MPRPSPGRRPFAELFTLHDITTRTHLSRDTIQRWGNIGLLLSEPHTTHAGKGVRRRFRGSELIIATLLRPFQRLDVPAGQLASLAEVLRQNLGFAHGMEAHGGRDRGLPAVRPLIQQALDRGLYTHKETYLAIGFSRGKLVVEPIFNVDEDDDEPAEWRPSRMYRNPEWPPPEIVHLIDLASLYGVLGEPPAAP